MNTAAPDRFMTTREVMTYLRKPTMSATYCWLHRKGIVRDGCGLVERADVGRARKRRSRRGRHPNSLRNLNTAVSG